MTLPVGVTLAGLKGAVDIKGSTRDADLERRLEASIGDLASHTGRTFLPTPALVNTGTDEDPVWEDTDDPVTLAVDLDGSRWIRLPDAREITSVVLDGVDVPAYYPEDVNGWRLRKNRRQDPETWPKPYIELRCGGGQVKVTGRFGFAELDAQLIEAIYAVAARKIYEQDVGYMDSVRLNEFGDRTYFKQFPATVQTTIQALTVERDPGIG